MKTKILIILIILTGLFTGTFFVYKKWFASGLTTETSTEVKNKEEKVDKQQKEIFWIKDEGIRIFDGGVPFATKLDDGRIRLYYCGQGGIFSAVSGDSLNFQKENGVRVSGGCDPTIIKLSDGRYRMYYKVQSGLGGPGEAIHKIYSAISSDGLNFKKEGLRIDSEKTGDNGWVSVPEVVMIPDGKVRIYYVSGDPEASGGIMSAISSDGLNFEKEEGVRVKGNYVDPAVLVLNGKYYLFVAHQMNPEKEKVNPNDKPGIYYLVSEDGLNFSEPKLALEGEGMIDSSVIQIDAKRFKMYYGMITGSETMQTKSATGMFK